MPQPIDTGRQFDADTLAYLRSLAGATLLSYEGYMPFDERNVYATARLRFEGGAALDLANRHEPIVVGPDYEQEAFAVLAASPASQEALWHPPGKQLTRVELDMPVSDVLVVVDTVLLSKGSRRLNRLKLVQAVVFETPGGHGAPELLAFDRDIWSDEYLNVARGPKVSAVTRDMRGDYVAEPPYSYRFSRDVLRLSQPDRPRR